MDIQAKCKSSPLDQIMQARYELENLKAEYKKSLEILQPLIKRNLDILNDQGIDNEVQKQYKKDQVQVQSLGEQQFKQTKKQTKKQTNKTKNTLKRLQKQQLQGIEHLSKEEQQQSEQQKHQHEDKQLVKQIKKELEDHSKFIADQLNIGISQIKQEYVVNLKKQQDQNQNTRNTNQELLKQLLDTQNEIKNNQIKFFEWQQNHNQLFQQYIFDQFK